MARIIIRRNSEWANKFRPFKLLLNGKKFAEIHDNELISFDLPEGDYVLMAKIDWCGSKPIKFKLSENDEKRIEVTGFIFSKYYLPVAILSGIIYFLIYFKYGTNSLLLGTILMFFLGYLIYFLSFGRNEYLRLIEK